MMMKTCIAAVVALGCILAVPSASFAADEKDKSATSTTKKPKAAAHKSHKMPMKGHADTAHEHPQ
jgi:maltose-binding protein MalE